MAEELGDIDGIGPATLEELEGVGISTVEDLANSSVEEVSSCSMSSTRAEDIINQAQQSTVDSRSLLEVEEEYNNRETIETGLDKLDEAIDGGFDEEAMVSVWGGSGSGKTQFCFDVMVKAVEKTGDPAIYIETEKDRLQPERIRSIASDEETLKKIKKIDGHGLDQQYNAYGKALEDYDNASIVIVDSLTARIRLCEDLEGRSTLGKRKALISRHLNKLEEVGEKFECPVLFTNQSSINPDNYGKNEIQYGGSIVQHTAQFFIHMDEGQGETHVACVQNHPVTGNTEITININEDGIDEV